MSTLHHTPHATGFDLRAANFNAPLGQLDAAIESVAVNASGVTTTLDGSAASGQKVIPLTSTTGLTAGQSGIIMSDDGTDSETVTIASVSAGVSITATTNLTNSYASGDVFSLSPVELALARGGYSSLGARLEAAFGATGGTQRFLQAMYRESQDLSIVIVGDSTSRNTGSWPSLFVADFAEQWPAWTVEYAEWNDGGSSWPSTTVIQSGTGDRTLTVWNAAVGSKNIAYHMGRLQAAITDKLPDLVLIAHGFNEPTGFTFDQPVRIDLARARMLMLTESILERSPASSICIIAQNPLTSSSDALQWHQDKIAGYAQVAAMRGYGWIDVWRAFWATGNAGSLTSDGTHPTTAGYRLYADTVLRHFVLQPEATPLPQPESTFLSGNTINLLTNGDFSDFASPPTLPGWTASGATLTKDTEWYEGRKGYSLRITASGSGSSYIVTETSEAGNLAGLLAGQWVTVAARVRVFSVSDNLNAGVLSLTTTSASSATAASVPLGQYGSFIWHLATMFVPTDTTALRVWLTAGYSGNPTTAVSVDRIILVRGMLPRDIQ